MANAQAPSAPVPNTDNDMTLPWDDPPDDQEQPPIENAANGSSGPAADNNDTQAVEPIFAETQQQAPPPTLLPETQVNDVPAAVSAGLFHGSGQQIASLESAGVPHGSHASSVPALGLPNVPVAEPTQLAFEPTQLAFPLGPSATPAGGSSAPQAGTALASAAAQAMTGAQPTQASLLPSSAGFTSGMPSLAQSSNQSQPAVNAAGTSTPGASRRADGAGPSASMLPISRPQADAVLHVPSQPSGSQHAAHPHGPPRLPESTTAGQPPSDNPAVDQAAGSNSQSQPHAQAADAGKDRHTEHQQQHSPRVPDGDSHRTSVGMSADTSGQSALLDSILGHDDDDSIWMPPASIPDSQEPSPGAEPAALPAAGGQDLPLQPELLSAGTPRTCSKTMSFHFIHSLHTLASCRVRYIQ